MAAASPINKKSIKKAPEIYQDLEIPFNLKGQYAQESEGEFYMTPVNQGVRNVYGMQNMFSNVAEMTDQNGVAKGVAGTTRWLKVPPRWTTTTLRLALGKDFVVCVM